MDISAYFQRIGYSGTTVPGPAALRELHKAHMVAVPFENLDIHLNRPIVLAEDALFQKIVLNRRGGFCYELNGLFCALLRSLGFRVSMLSAGVAQEHDGFGPEFDHMTLLVELEQNWLADVGFGDSFVEPLLLDAPGEQLQPAGAYRIDRSHGSAILMRRMAGVWAPQYCFRLEPHSTPEYGDMCLYHQTSAQSSFTRKRVVSRATPYGRITLSELRLITTTWDGQRTEHEVPDAREYERVLLDCFGIDLRSVKWAGAQR